MPSSYIPAYTSQVLKNQYSEPAPRSPLPVYSLLLFSSNDKEHRAFQENESPRFLDFDNGYC